MKRTSLNTAILFLMMVIGLAALSSCGSKVQVSKNNVEETPYVWRATVLENGTVTHVAMTYTERVVTKPGDQVWVNLTTHRIDDVDTTAMKCTLESCTMVGN